MSRSILAHKPQPCSLAFVIWQSAKQPRVIVFTTRPIPSSQIACTIGGNVAENSGGVHCLKYGLTVHDVLRVRGLTIEGEQVEFGGLAPDAPSLDLLALVIGSEGMLAVVTEVTVRLVPVAQTARCIMASFADVGEAGDAVAALIADGIIPAGLEMLDQAASRLVEPFANAGYDLDAAAVLLCESDGTPEEVAEEIERMSAVLLAARATRIQVSNSEAERLRFWAGRKNAFPSRRSSLACLLLHGWHDPAAPARRSVESDPVIGAEVWVALPECISRGRRQLASTDPVR